MLASFGIMYFIGLAFLFVLAVCWLILPFALIGTKPLLRELLAETKRTNAILADRLPALRQ